MSLLFARSKASSLSPLYVTAPNLSRAKKRGHAIRRSETAIRASRPGFSVTISNAWTAPPLCQQSERPDSGTELGLRQGQNHSARPPRIFSMPTSRSRGWLWITVLWPVAVPEWSRAILDAVEST